MFFCCSAKSKKSKQPLPSQHTTDTQKPQSHSVDLRDTVFIVGKGWVEKPRNHPQPKSAFINQQNPLMEEKLSENQDKMDALEGLQGIAKMDRIPDWELERRMRELRNKMDHHDGKGVQWVPKQDIQIVRNTLLAGDQAPLDE